MKRWALKLDAATARAPICARLALAIRELRRALGLTQERLAAEAGISLRMVRYIEKGKKIPTIDLVERIAAALELTFEELGLVAAWFGRVPGEQV